MNSKNVTLNTNVDKDKIKYDLNLFLDETDSPEDIECVMNTRKEYGVSNEDMDELTQKINNKSTTSATSNNHEVVETEVVDENIQMNLSQAKKFSEDELRQLEEIQNNNNFTNQKNKSL